MSQKFDFTHAPVVHIHPAVCYAHPHHPIKPSVTSWSE